MLYSSHLRFISVSGSLLRLLLFFSLAIIPVIAMSCGGDGERSRAEVKVDLGAFFDKYTAIQKDVTARIVGLKAKYPKGYLYVMDKPETDLQQTRDSYREYTALYDEFDSRVHALNPPPEISDVVQQLLEADRVVSNINHDRVTKLEAVASTAELSAILSENEAITEATGQTVRACSTLIERARQYDYEPDLPCGGS